MILAINNSWAFPSPSGSIDPYVYTGYFLDLKHHLNFFPDLYYGSRLPWILLGAAAHSLFRFEVAQYALRLILFYSATLSLFAVVWMLFRNEAAAAISVLALSVDPSFLGAIGWDYVDGAGVSLILLLTACLTAAGIGQRWRAWLVGAGAAGLSLVACNLTLGVLVPILVANYLAVNRLHRRNPFSSGALCFVVGGALAFAVFGAMNGVLTGRFLFILPQVKMAFGLTSAANVYKSSTWTWLSGAPWLILPEAAFALAVVLLLALPVARKKSAVTAPVAWHAAISAATLVAIAVTFVLMDGHGFALLEYHFYADYLLPSAFVCLGAAIALSMARLSPAQSGRLLVATAVALLLPLIILSHYHVPRPAFGELIQPGVCAAIGAGFLAFAALSSRAWLVLPATLALACGNLETADPRMIELPRTGLSYARTLMIPDAVTALRPYNTDGSLRFWYHLGDPLGGVFRAIASTDLWAYRVVSEDFPQLTALADGKPTALGVNDTVAFMTTNHDAVARVKAALGEQRTDAELLSSREIVGGAERFTLIVFRVTPSEVEGTGELDLNELHATPNAVLPATRGIIVRTLPLAWAYAVQVPIAQSLRDRFKECAAAFNIHGHVRRGTLGLGVLNAAGTEFLARRMVRPTPDAVEVLLDVPRLQDAGNLVMQSWDTPTEGLMEVESISVIGHHCQAPR